MGDSLPLFTSNFKPHSQMSVPICDLKANTAKTRKWPNHKGNKKRMNLCLSVSKGVYEEVPSSLCLSICQLVIARRTERNFLFLSCSLSSIRFKQGSFSSTSWSTHRTKSSACAQAKSHKTFFCYLSLLESWSWFCADWTNLYFSSTCFNIPWCANNQSPVFLYQSGSLALIIFTTVNKEEYTSV